MAVIRRSDTPSRQGVLVAWLAGLGALLLLMAAWLISSHGMSEREPWRLTLPVAERDLPALPNPEPMPIPPPRPVV